MENINFEFYKTFYYVAKNKNITASSEELLISQPAITQTIKKLEDNLNYKLIYRTSRGIELTTQGEQLYNRIKNSVECLDSCKNYLTSTNEELKVIKIAGGNTLLKHNAIEGFKIFKDTYPNIKLEIVKGITSDLITKLDNNEVDIVLFNMPTNLTENIEYKIIEEVEDVFVANTKYYQELKNKKIKITNLNNLPLVLQSDVSSSRKFLDSICKKNKVTLNNKYELESYDLVLSFVKAGLGIGFINKNHLEEELKKDELFIIDLDYKIPKRQIGVAYNKKNINNKYINEFIKYIIK